MAYSEAWTARRLAADLFRALRARTSCSCAFQGGNHSADCDLIKLNDFQDRMRESGIQIRRYDVAAEKRGHRTA